MYPNHDALKLLVEEHHRELIAQRQKYHQLNRRADSGITSWVRRRFDEFVDNRRIHALLVWLFPKPIRTSPNGIELTECQATPECNSC